MSFNSCLRHLELWVAGAQTKLDTFKEWYSHIHYSIIENTPAKSYSKRRNKIGILSKTANNFGLPNIQQALTVHKNK